MIGRSRENKKNKNRGWGQWRESHVKKMRIGVGGTPILIFPSILCDLTEYKTLNA